MNFVSFDVYNDEFFMTSWEGVRGYWEWKLFSDVVQKSVFCPLLILWKTAILVFCRTHGVVSKFDNSSDLQTTLELRSY